MRMHQPSAPWPSMKKIQSISLSEKNSGEYRNIYCLIESLSCAKINLFSSTIIAKNWKHGCARIAVFLSTSIAENWNLVFQAIFLSFFCSQLAFVFHLQKDFYTGYCNILMCLLTLFVFLFLRKILIPFASLYFKLFFAFWIISSGYFYTWGKKSYIKNLFFYKFWQFNFKVT